MAPGQMAPPPVGAAQPYAPAPPPVPPVPTGPGVRPPFAAPPVQKAGGTLALWLIFSGLVMVLCLLGGGVGIGFAVYAAFQDTDQEARAVAGAYLDALSEERFEDAYQMTCKPLREKIGKDEFVRTKQRDPQIVDYELDTMLGYEAGVMVPARIELAGGDRLTIGLVLVREPVGAGEGADAKTEFRICGEEENPNPGPS
ncbi:MAG: hypothetical protein ACRDT6_09755 [Micromonosporaceae bacterium]